MKVNINNVKCKFLTYIQNVHKLHFYRLVQLRIYIKFSIFTTIMHTWSCVCQYFNVLYKKTRLGEKNKLFLCLLWLHSTFTCQVLFLMPWFLFNFILRLLAKCCFWCHGFFLTLSVPLMNDRLRSWKQNTVNVNNSGATFDKWLSISQACVC